jgi:alkane 1-monooxygenase
LRYREEEQEMGGQAVLAEDSARPGKASYVDRKRYLWIVAPLCPLVPLLGIFLAIQTGAGIFNWTTIILWYGFVTLLDWIIGPDASNPPAAIDEDRYYRYLSYLIVAIHYVVFFVGVWYVGTHSLSWFSLLGLTLSIGMISGLGINVGHELGHKDSRIERFLAKSLLALVGYGHFYIEHNKGHHRDVATPEDPASARYGESIYRFAGREIPGALRRAWTTEAARLARHGNGAWNWRNELLQPLAFTVLLYAALIAVFGPIIIPFLIAQAAVGWWQLTSANYIEHYGLLRRKLPNGRYERCRPEHSWNSNHLISNLALLHLQRHSDHHAHPMRRYQSLRNFDGLPQLPAGYPAMYMIALVPPLWRRVMDHRLLKQVGGDLSHVNIDPRIAARV